MSRSEYENLRPPERGTIDPDYENWTFWSAPHAASGEVIPAEGPARYLQFEILFESRTPMARTVVDSLAIEYSPQLLAQALTGELIPTRVEPGEVAQLTFSVRAEVTSANRGFDGLHITSPEAPSVDGVWIDGVPIADYSAEIGEDGFTVTFPQHRVTSSATVEVSLRTRVFINGTRLVCEAVEAGTNEVPQKAVPGDASPLSDDDDTVVHWIGPGTPIVSAVEVEPPIVTPNGDGVNDRLRISFSLLQALKPLSLTVQVRDLTGRSAWRADWSAPSGRRTVVWEGHGQDGKLVPAGLYVYELVAPAQSGDAVHRGTLCIAH